MATEVAGPLPAYPGVFTPGGALAYQRHRPEEAALYTAVREQLENFLARAREGDRPAPPRPPVAAAAAEVQGPLPEKDHDAVPGRPRNPQEQRDTAEKPAAGANASCSSRSASRNVPPRRAPDAVDRPDLGRRLATERPVPRRLPWAELLQRVFEVDALRCPECGAQMRLLAAIEDAEVARKILECLGLPARGPPLAAPAGASADVDRGSWDEESSWDFDQTPLGA